MKNNAKEKHLRTERRLFHLLNLVRDGEFNLRDEKDQLKLERMGAKYNQSFAVFGPGAYYIDEMDIFLSFQSLIGHFTIKTVTKKFSAKVRHLEDMKIVNLEN